MNEKYLRLLEENGKKGKYMTNPKNMRTMTISPLLIFEFGQTSSSDVASYWRMLRPFPPLCRPAWRSWYRTLMTVLVTFSHNCSFSWKFEIAGQNSYWDIKDFWLVFLKFWDYILTLLLHTGLSSSPNQSSHSACLASCACAAEKSVVVSSNSSAETSAVQCVCDIRDQSIITLGEFFLSVSRARSRF